MKGHKRSKTSLPRITSLIIDDMDSLFDSYIASKLDINFLADEARIIIKSIDESKSSISCFNINFIEHPILSSNLFSAEKSCHKILENIDNSVDSIEEMILEIEFIEDNLSDDFIDVVKSLASTRSKRIALIEEDIETENKKHNDLMDELFKEKALLSYKLNKKL